MVIKHLEFTRDYYLTVMAETSNTTTMRKVAHENSRFEVWISISSIDDVVCIQNTKLWHDIFKPFDLYFPSFPTDLFDTK